VFTRLKRDMFGLGFAGFTSIMLAACASMMTSPTGILPEGAKWQEVSRAGLFTSEGVVAAKDGKIYVSDITRPDEVKQNNPGGTIYRYDPATGATAKYMEPSGMSNGLHVDRNGDLIIAQEAEGGGRAILRRNLTTGATTVVASSYQGKRLNSPNDVTSDGRGRIYFTDARYFGNEPHRATQWGLSNRSRWQNHSDLNRHLSPEWHRGSARR
jgi:gluconolactonase